MKKQTRQLGFAHLGIITIAVTLALIGTLGFVFYQNFIQKKTNLSSSETNKNKTPVKDNKTTEVADNLPNSVLDSVTGSKLGLKYPDGWTVANTTNPNPDKSQGNVIEIKSPDDAITVKLWTNISGIGGVCGPVDVRKLDKFELKNYSGYSLYTMVWYLNDEYNGYVGYNYSARVLKDDNDTAKIAVGITPCGLGMGVFSPKTNDDMTVMLAILPNNLNRIGTETMENINNAMSNKYYSTAIEIAQSLYSTN